MTFQSLTHPDDLEADLTLLAQAAIGDIEHYTLDKRYLRADGRVVSTQAHRRRREPRRDRRAAALRGADPRHRAGACGQRAARLHRGQRARPLRGGRPARLRVRVERGRRAACSAGGAPRCSATRWPT
nr:hypothetical protein [Angustibacter aerolatus]